MPEVYGVASSSVALSPVLPVAFLADVTPTPSVISAIARHNLVASTGFASEYSA